MAFAELCAAAANPQPDLINFGFAWVFPHSGTGQA